MEKEQKEREYFLSEIKNLFSLCEKRNAPVFSSFLNEQQQAEARRLLAGMRGTTKWMFFGGYDDADRVILGVFPDYMDPCQEDFPILGYTFTYPESFTLTHRDFLGSLMGQQIKRETIGDILVKKGVAVVYCEERVEKVLSTQISQVGRVGVSVVKGVPEDFVSVQQFQELTGTVASLRLDAIVALISGLSREKAQRAILSGMVMHNYLEKKDTSAPVAEGDIITVRGKGKFRMEKILGNTKKGRVSVLLLAYRDRV